MYCPKCKKENPKNAKFCQFCNASITNTLDSKQPVTVTVSKLASFSLTCALCGCALIVPSLIVVKFPRILSPRTVWVAWTFLISLFLIAGSLILGIISIVRIEIGGGKITGRTYAVAAVLVAVFAGIFPVWLVISMLPVKSTAYRMVCGTNLAGIGKAMYHYANDYDNEFPRAGGPNSKWGRTANWQADNRYNAYGLSQDGSGGRATVSSSFYLLVKYMEVQPKSFLCKGDAGISVFNPSKDGVKNKDLIDLWDFGPEPTKHCSYSYHMPYGPYALTTSYLPGVAVAADRNPWMASPFVKAKRNFNKFNPDGGREKSNIGNAVAHQGNGQNVLFMDSHVGFERHSFCGINDDNIYTYWDGSDIRRGAIPNLKSRPIGRLDSMLVNDLP
ncbi:MAG: hypothetical protein ACYS30_25080 [Planctomycetota bacterium]|jgi:hypothetical protein